MSLSEITSLTMASLSILWGLFWALSFAYSRGVRHGRTETRSRLVHSLRVRKLVSMNEGDAEASRVLRDLALLLATSDDDVAKVVTLPADEPTNVVALRRSTFEEIQP